MPDAESDGGDGEGLNGATIYMRGRILFNNCRDEGFRKFNRCGLGLAYGIEKYFGERKKARKLEKLRPVAINAEQGDWEVDLRQKILIARAWLRQETSRKDGGDKKKIAELSARLSRLNSELTNLLLMERLKREQAVRTAFGVIVRVDRKSGEAAIAGLMIGGAKVYEESLFSRP
jgi:hypothetical protein